jgi:translation elongation factor EF-Tu-like GTPase
MNRRNIHASISLLSASENGRLGPLVSGYRSLLRFEGSGIDFGFELHLDSDLGASELAPGESGKVRLSFWAVEEFPILSSGQKFEIREGVRVIGHGSILDTQTKATTPDS